MWTERRLRPAGQVLDRMLDELGPALRRNGDEDLVHRLVRLVQERGTGADLQRAELARRGRGRDVVHAAVARTAGQPVR